MRKILLICALVISLFANDAQHLKTMVQEKSNTVVSILKNSSISREIQDSQIDNTLSDIFDYTTMAKLSLGKENWSKLVTKEQQKEYISLFTKYATRSYYNKLHLLSDQEVKVEDSKVSKSRAFVTSEIISKDNDSTKLVYKFYNSKKGWLIYDVEIAGVSVVQSYRTQFQDTINNGGTKKLLEKLRDSDPSNDA